MGFGLSVSLQKIETSSVQLKGLFYGSGEGSSYLCTKRVENKYPSKQSDRV